MSSTSKYESETTVVVIESDPVISMPAITEKVKGGLMEVDERGNLYVRGDDKETSVFAAGNWLRATAHTREYRV